MFTKLQAKSLLDYNILFKNCIIKVQTNIKKHVTFPDKKNTFNVRDGGTLSIRLK